MVADLEQLADDVHELLERRVAAIYVDPTGPYPRMAGVDCWFESPLFDARAYPGPHPVVAHPPCARWCKLAGLVEHRWGRKKGDDGGLFAHALEAVRRYGGVLEHPAWSLAWPAYGLVEPPRARAWHQVSAREWVCEVHQSAYGHRAKKATWLLYVGDVPPEPIDPSSPKATMVVGHAVKRGDGTWWRDNRLRMSKAEARHSPPRFAEYLVRLARSSRA